MVQFDYSKLRGRIKEVLNQEVIFANKIGISQASLSAKFNNKSDFTASQISKACAEDVLNIPIEEIGIYFFNKKLELNSRTQNTA